ncbi:MAG: UDP-N-acetylmuramoyl-tripeptide--D-alanyl-D-alanine ligase [Candidatus Aceula meridiana]|nr:UDP-N-acetylmuramoyl-tripeptide--D-alanyl-D-alanine ligase [Candidatus Aceula meridiana]
MLSIQDIQDATGGRVLQGDLGEKICSVAIDSRSIKKNELFVAIKGKNFDGHRFISQAILKGAKAAVVSKKIKIRSKTVAVIRVANTTKALGDIARFHRSRFKIPVVAITASAGKTTTKEMIASVLSRKYKVLKNYSTENNEIGVAKTLLQLKALHQIAVLELGTNHFGEMRNLTLMAQPTVAILLNIGKSHLEFLKNLSGVFREKSSIYKSMKPGGTIIFNADDEKLCRIKIQKLPHKKISFSINEKSDYRATKVNRTKDTKISFFVKKNRFLMPASTPQHVYNALAAISCGRLFDVRVSDAQKALKSTKHFFGRQKIYQKKGCWIIDDTYNANPLSVEAALQSLKSFPTKGRRFFILGDMLELGRNSRKEHQLLSRLVRESSVDVLVTVGSLSAHCASKLRNTEVTVLSCRQRHDVVRKLKPMLKRGDVLLAKGSRAMRIEEILIRILS